MKSETWVKVHYPSVRVVIEKGAFSGGRTRTSIFRGATRIGCDTRPRSAWAEAMRYLKAQGEGK